MFFEKCKIVMYGLGEIGEKFWYKNCKFTDLKFCVDKSDFKQKNGFHGYEVISPDILSHQMLGEAKIVVTTRLYEEIKQILLKKGFKEFVDFIPYGLFRKELVIVFGNCYIYYIKQALQRQKDFNQKYYIYEIEPIYARNGEKIDDNLMKNATVFLCQDIRVNNKYSEYLSFDYLKTRVNEKCIVICYPNLVGFSKFIFPQLTKKEEIEYDTENKISLMRRDRVLDFCIEKKWDLDQTLDFAKTYSFNDIDLNQLKKISVKKFFEREKKWDIKIMQYIIDRLSIGKVMIDDYHPSITVMEEIVKNIMNYLHLEYRYCKNEIKWQMDYFIYPKVIDRLQFQFKDTYIRDPNKCYYWFTDEKIDFEEYIKQYLFFFS